MEKRGSYCDVTVESPAPGGQGPGGQEKPWTGTGRAAAPQRAAARCRGSHGGPLTSREEPASWGAALSGTSKGGRGPAGPTRGDRHRWTRGQGRGGRAGVGRILGLWSRRSWAWARGLSEGWDLSGSPTFTSTGPSEHSLIGKQGLGRCAQVKVRPLQIWVGPESKGRCLVREEGGRGLRARGEDGRPRSATLGRAPRQPGTWMDHAATHLGRGHIHGPCREQGHAQPHTQAAGAAGTAEREAGRVLSRRLGGNMGSGLQAPASGPGGTGSAVRAARGGAWLRGPDTHGSTGRGGAGRAPGTAGSVSRRHSSETLAQQL